MASKKQKTIGKKVEKIIGSVVGEIIGLTISLIFIIYVFPRLPFITHEYGKYMPIAIWTGVLSSSFKIVKHLSPKPKKYFLETLSFLPTIYSTMKLLEIFPVDFGLIGKEGINDVFRIGMYFLVIVLSFAALANLLKGFGLKSEKVLK